MLPSTLVIVPTYNERENLPVLVRELLAYPAVRVLVVDDASPDGTGQLADQLRRQLGERIDVIHRCGQRGLGRSYVDAIHRAVVEPVDLICQMDADLSHDPRHLPALVQAASYADVVIGSRYVEGGSVVNWPVRRQLLSRAANAYVRSVTRLKPRDCTSGYRCWKRETLARLPVEGFASDGYAFLVELLFFAARQGARIAEVPITFVERRAGQSKLSSAVMIESAIMPWRLVSRSENMRHDMVPSPAQRSSQVSQ